MRVIFFKTLAVIAIIALGFWLILYAYNAILGFGETGDTTVPDLRLKTADQAQAIAKQDGLVFSIQRNDFSDSVPKNEIMSQDPDPGMSVKKGRTVQVVVSNGPEQSTVPDLRGLDLREAEVQLENLKLKTGTISYVLHPVARKGVVVDQDPPAGSDLKSDSVVSLTVSSGPPPDVAMPNLIGNDLDYARNVLKDNDLQMGQIGWQWDDTSAAGTVLTQNPAPNAKTPQQSMVSLVVSAGPKDDNLPFKQSYITVLLPQFQGEKEVTIYVTDQATTSEVYEGMHTGGETIRLMISAFGDSTVQVKLGDQILSTGKL